MAFGSCGSVLSEFALSWGFRAVVGPFDVSPKATSIAYLALILPVHLEVPQGHRQCAS